MPDPLAGSPSPAYKSKGPRIIRGQRFKTTSTDACRERENKVKSIKMLGLAAIAALMAMALIGVSSAMAESTALCKADESTCSEANEISHVHEATLAGAKAKLLTSAATVECDALFLGDVAGASVAPVEISGNFTYTNCKRGTENCTATETSTSSSIEVLRLGHETADVTGEGEVNVHCGFIINCTYNGEELLGTGKGPLLSTETNGEVSISEQTTKHTSGAFCPATGKLDIVTTPLEKVSLTSSRKVLLCVEVDSAAGVYNNTGCSTKGTAAENIYVKGWVNPGTAAGAMVCIRVAPNTGLYLKIKSGLIECETQDNVTPRVGRYELGIAR